MPVESFRDLIVWQEGMQLAATIYRTTESFPKHELYGLVSQMRRCSVSIPSNISEGHARATTPDYLRHVSIAIGSLAELETQILLSQELEYLDGDVRGPLLSQCDLLGRRLRSLTASLRSRIARLKNE